MKVKLPKTEYKGIVKKNTFEDIVAVLVIGLVLINKISYIYFPRFQKMYCG